MRANDEAICSRGVTLCADVFPASQRVTLPGPRVKTPAHFTTIATRSPIEQPGFGPVSVRFKLPADKMIHFFTQTSLFPHCRYSTVFFSMKMTESEKIILALLISTICKFGQDSLLESQCLQKKQKKLGVSPANLIKSTKVLMATPQGRRLGYHTPEQVSNQEPPDSRPCVLTITLLGP